MMQALEWLGFALIVAGIAFWSVPASLIVAGLILVLAVNVRAMNGNNQRLH